jgi:hypothetical protein
MKWIFILDKFSYRFVGFEGYFNKIYLNNLVNKIVSFPTYLNVIYFVILFLSFKGLLSLHVSISLIVRGINYYAGSFQVLNFFVFLFLLMGSIGF